MWTAAALITVGVAMMMGTPSDAVGSASGTRAALTKARPTLNTRPIRKAGPIRKTRTTTKPRPPKNDITAKKIPSTTKVGPTIRPSTTTAGSTTSVATVSATTTLSDRRMPAGGSIPSVRPVTSSVAPAVTLLTAIIADGPSAAEAPGTVTPSEATTTASASISIGSPASLPSTTAPATSAPATSAITAPITIAPSSTSSTSAATTSVATTSTIPAAGRPARVVVYSRFDMADRFAGVDPMRLTHVIYAFVKTNTTTYATETLDPGGWPTRLMALKELRKANPALKLMVSVGGGGLSGDFPTVTSDAHRGATVAGAVEFLRANDLDGYDIDWEAPNNAAEKTQLTAFAADLRVAMTKLSATTKKAYVLSAAVFSYEIGIDGSFDVAALSPSLDFFNVMTYGLGGPWYTLTEHTFGLRVAAGSEFPLNAIEPGLTSYRNRGVPPGKLNAGVGFYGQKVSNVEPGPNGDGYRVTGGRWDPEEIFFSELQASFGPAQGFTDYYAPDIEAAYRYNPTTKQWISYANARSINAERVWAVANGYGLMVWSLANDDATHSLFAAMTGP